MKFAVGTISVPASWTAEAPHAIAGPVAPGESVNATFKVVSPAAVGAGFLTGKAEWTTPAARAKQFDTTSSQRS
jgi:hypothetical protein